MDEFIAKHGIAEDVKKAVAIAKETFSGLTNIETRHEQDYDCEGEWIAVRVFVNSSVPIFLKEYKICRRKWRNALSQKALSLLCLTHNIG